MLLLTKMGFISAKSNVTTAAILYRRDSKQLLAFWAHIVQTCLKQVYTAKLRQLLATSALLFSTAAEKEFPRGEHGGAGEGEKKKGEEPLPIKQNLHKKKKVLSMVILFTFSTTCFVCLHENKSYCSWSPWAKVKTGPNICHVDE